MQYRIVLLTLLFSVLFGTKEVFSQTNNLKETQQVNESTLNFNDEDIRSAVDFIWAEYYSNNLNESGAINADLEKKLSWRGSVAAMMFTHAYEVLGDLKYLRYAEQAYLVAYEKMSDDLAWAANSALEILNNLNTAPIEYKSLREKEYYIKDISDIYFSVTMPLGGSVSGQTKLYDTFSISYEIKDSNKQKSPKRYSAMMWSTDPTWGVNDPQFNSCSLGQSVVLSSLMAKNEIFDTYQPEIHASEWLKTQLDHLVNHQVGIVYDHIKLIPDDTKNNNFFYKTLDTREFTYNTATVLAALGLQDNQQSSSGLVSGERLQLYVNILNRIKEQFTKDMILTEYDTNPEFNQGETYGGDHAAFKGVFMHFLPYFYFSKTLKSERLKNLQDDYKFLVSKSANVVWNQLQNHNFTASYDWSSFDPTQTNSITTISAVESLITAWQFQKASSSKY